MKKAIFSLVALLSIAALSFTVDHTDTFTADAAASKLTWTGYKVTGLHAGTVNLKSGTLAIEHGVLKGGSFEIDMTSINCTENDYSPKLVGHLKSADFFGTDTYPTAKYVIKKAIAIDTKGNYKIVGDLTIKSTTKEVKFNVNLGLDATGAMATATGKIVIDRSEFDVKYGSGSFFDGLGDKTIYDDFDVNFTLVAKK